MFVLRSQHSYINRRRPGSLQLSFRLLDFYLRSDPAVETALIQVQSLLVLLDRRVEELFFGVQAAGLEVVKGKIGVHAEIDGGQVCRTGLRLFPIRLHRFSNSSPDVSLVGKREWQNKVVVGDAIKDGTRWRAMSRHSGPSRR